MNDAGEITIDFTGKSEFGIKAELFTAGGKELKSTDFVVTSNETNDRLVLKTAFLSAGEYIVRMKREGRTLFHRFVVNWVCKLTLPTRQLTKFNRRVF